MTFSGRLDKVCGQHSSFLLKTSDASGVNKMPYAGVPLLTGSECLMNLSANQIYFCVKNSSYQPTPEVSYVIENADIILIFRLQRSRMFTEAMVHLRISRLRRILCL